VLFPVSTAWVIASFPVPYREDAALREDLSVTRRLTADAAPFAVFNIEESIIVGDAFAAVGATEWVTTFGDDLLQRLRPLRAVAVGDTRTVTPCLTCRDIDGYAQLGTPALLRARVCSRFSPARDQGCVVVAWTIAQPNQAATAARFLRSVRLWDEAS
jgi:hypothetical protein